MLNNQLIEKKNGGRWLGRTANRKFVESEHVDVRVPGGSERKRKIYKSIRPGLSDYEERRREVDERSSRPEDAASKHTGRVVATEQQIKKTRPLYNLKLTI